MPGFPVAACEPCNFISTDQQPSPQEASANIPAEEKVAAEHSLSAFCPPVTLYKILHQRATEEPLFLARTIDGRIEAKKNKRIQMTVLLSWSDEEAQNAFPMYISLARRDPKNEDGEILTFRGSSGIDGNNKIEAKFMLSGVDKLAAEARSGSLFLLFFTTEGNSNSSSRVNANLGPSDPTSHESRAEKNCLYGKVSFQSIYMAWDSSPNFRWGQRAEIMSTVNLLPCTLKYNFQNKGTTIAIQDLWNSEIVNTSKKFEIKIFAEEFGAVERSLNHTNASNDVPSSSSLSRIIRLKEGNVTFNYRYYNNKLQRTEVTENFSCPFCLVRWASYKGLRCHLSASHDLFNFEFSASEDCPSVNVSVKNVIWRPEIIGEGIDPKLQTFIFRGKRIIDRSSEDAYFEEVQFEDSPVLVNNADSPALATDTDPPVLDNDVDPPVLANDVDPPVLANDVGPAVFANDADPPVLAMDVDPPVLAMDIDPPVLAIDAVSPVLAIDAVPPVLAIDVDPPVLATDADPLFLESATPLGDIEFLKKADGSSAIIPAIANASIVSNPDPDCVPPLSEHDHGTPSVPQVDNTGTLSVEHVDPQIVARLKKRQFYHSHRALPMSLEEVLSNYDSEDDLDDETADIEERRRLNLIKNANKDQKQFMFMWNSFIRKQRVKVDAHLRWACKAFSILHGKDLVNSRELNWQWTLFRLKLYNMRLIDGKIMNDCGIILQQYEKQKSNPEISLDNINSILLSPAKKKRKR